MSNMREQVKTRSIFLKRRGRRGGNSLSFLFVEHVLGYGIYCCFGGRRLGRGECFFLVFGDEDIGV